MGSFVLGKYGAVEFLRRVYIYVSLYEKLQNRFPKRRLHRTCEPCVRALQTPQHFCHVVLPEVLTLPVLATQSAISSLLPTLAFSRGVPVQAFCPFFFSWVVCFLGIELQAFSVGSGYKSLIGFYKHVLPVCAWPVQFLNGVFVVVCS